MMNPRPDSLAYRALDDGMELVLYPMIFNVRLCIGAQGESCYDDAWCYAREDTALALGALQTWNGEGTPPGPIIKRVGE